MKVLLFSNDTMPFGPLPTSGGGLRCWQLYQGLRSQGIEVVASMPAFTYLTKKYFDVIPEDVRENLWEWHTQDEIYARVKPDAVLFASNWDHYNLSHKPDVPLIIDLHGSRLIETTMWGEAADTNKKGRIFSLADCLLCAGKKQQKYFYGWLLQAGRAVPEEEFIRYIPISLAPEKFEREPCPDAPTFVSGGGWFPWQDQSEAIFGIAKEIARRDAGCLKIYGTPHDNAGVLSPEELHIRSIFQRVTSLAEQSDRIRVEGYVGRDDLLREYARASVAVELMKYNLERELAFTTRTIEYLWCGLPVLYNDYSEISEHIREYDAGWTVPPDDGEKLQAVLEEMFSRPDLVQQKSKNAQKLVQDRFDWSKTIAPLVQFLHAPVRRQVSKPVFYIGGTRAPYLQPEGRPDPISLRPREELVQELITPAEGVWGITLHPMCVTTESSPGGAPVDGGSVSSPLRSRGELLIKVTNHLGVPISRSKILLKDADERNGVTCTFNPLLKPRGGSALKLHVSLQGGEDHMVFKFKGFEHPVYPLRDLVLRSSVTADGAGRETASETRLEGALKIDFLAGTSRLLHYKNLLAKGVSMLGEGDFKRIERAVRRRLPGAVSRRIMSYESLRVCYGKLQRTFGEKRL